MRQKHLALLLLILVCTSLFCACKQAPVNLQNSSNVEFMSAKIERTLIYDKNDIKIELVGLHWVDNDGLDLLFHIDDNQNRKLVLNDSGEVVLNGSFVLPTSIGKVRGDGFHAITIKYQDIVASEIKDIHTVKIDNLYLYDQNLQQIIEHDIDLYVEPTTYTNIPPIYDPNSVILETNDAKLYYHEVIDEDGTIIYTLRLKNMSDAKLSIMFDNIKVDDDDCIEGLKMAPVGAYKNTNYCLNVKEFIGNIVKDTLVGAKSISFDLMIYNHESNSIVGNATQYVINIE